MTSSTADQWISHARHTLKRYDEALLRQVAHKLCKPRNRWPVDELLDRIVSAVNNAAMVDRRLKELPAACRQILAIIGQSRQSRWATGSLIEILISLGHADGLAPIVTLLESGLLLPELYPFGTSPDDTKPSSRGRLRNFETFLGLSDPMPMLLAMPQVTRRVLGEDLGIACPESNVPAKDAVHEADGLEWPLRIAVLWQQVLSAPLRRTQQGDFFKRDHDRLRNEPLLSSAPTDVLAPLPDPGFFASTLASAVGLLEEESAELRAGSWPAAFKGSLPNMLAECWMSILRIASWNSSAGHAPASGPGNPYPAAYLLAMLLLARLPEGGWAAPDAIEEWVVDRHPYWRDKKSVGPGLANFLLSVAYSLRLLQAGMGPQGWLVRLSPLGRWVMGLTEHPPASSSFKQTLLVQPNLEILAYRQGLTPELIATLSKIATWKTLGAACTLQLEPHSVYRALEMGETQVSIVQLLEGHGMKAVPTAVLDSLKTWSSKRDRISIYPAGAVLEFASPTEMNEAIARGVPATRLTDRLAVVANEKDLEYKHFRLTGTRDYTLPPEKCVDVEADGVTLNVDLARSDLLLETEIVRFAEPTAFQASLAGSASDGSIRPSSASATATGRRGYRLTPASIAAARQQNLNLAYLETWFAQRTGLPIPAAAMLLMVAPMSAPVELKRQVVLHVGNEHIADGLQQWPSTRPLVAQRLGPTVLAVAEDDVPLLSERLKELGVQLRFEA